MVLGIPSIRLRPRTSIESGSSSGNALPERDLDRFGGAFADQKIVLALDVLRDGFVHLVAGDADGTRINDTRKRDDRDVGRSAADIDDHVAVRFGDRQAGTDRRRHRFFNQINFGRLCAIRRVFDRAALDLRDLGRDADHHTRAHPRFAVVRLADKMLEHLFRHFEVGDDAVLHRTDRDDIARRAAEHLFRVAADRLDLIRDFVDRNDRGFADDDAAALCVNKRVRRAQIDRQIAGK